MRYLYDVFAMCEEKDCNDLTIALAMFAHEHPEADITHEKDKAMREFMGRHYEELVAAFKAHDRAVFDAAGYAGQGRPEQCPPDAG